MTPLSYRAATFPTPLGPMIAVLDARGALVRLDFAQTDTDEDLETWHGFAITRDRTALANVRDQIHAYFDGKLTAFDVPIAPIGNPFQQSVWALLYRIPYGVTTYYGALARQLGQPGAARAVGRANALNPISIIVPCHRVIGADGKLVGYAGGLPRKVALLALEGPQGSLIL